MDWLLEKQMRRIASLRKAEWMTRGSLALPRAYPFEDLMSSSTPNAMDPAAGDVYPALGVVAYRKALERADFRLVGSFYYRHQEGRRKVDMFAVENRALVATLETRGAAVLALRFTARIRRDFRRLPFAHKMLIVDRDGFYSRVDEDANPSGVVLTVDGLYAPRTKLGLVDDAMVHENAWWHRHADPAVAQSLIGGTARAFLSECELARWRHAPTPSAKARFVDRGLRRIRTLEARWRDIFDPDMERTLEEARSGIGETVRRAG